MKRRLLPVLVIMLVTGCSSSTAGGTTVVPGTEAPAGATSATPKPVVMGPGEYTFENATGTVGAISIPGTPDPEIEKLRAFVGSEPVDYLTVKVDNRKGTVGVSMFGVSILTPDGQELNYENASDYLDDIRPTGTPAELFNAFTKLGDQHREPAKPLMVKDFVLVGPAVPAGISSVKVYPTDAVNPVDALPAN